MSELDRIELRVQVLELAAMTAEDGADCGRVKFIAQQFWSWVVAGEAPDTQ